jgi:hypothetical protein
MSNLVVSIQQEDSISPTKNSNKTKNTNFSSVTSHYVFRDLILWIVLIFFLPLLLFGVYYLTREPLMNKMTTHKYSKNSFSSTRSEVLAGRKLLRRPMRKISLENYANSLCMDGSPANYYLRHSKTNSKTWIIFLEGGFLCHDSVSCRQRSSSSFELTSSLTNKLFKEGSGVLSYSSNENMHLYDANAV